MIAGHVQRLSLYVFVFLTLLHIPHAAENGTNPTELASVEKGLRTTSDLTEESTLRSAEAQYHRGKLGGVCVNFPRAGYNTIPRV